MYRKGGSRKPNLAFQYWIENVSDYVECWPFSEREEVGVLARDSMRVQN